VSTDFEQLHKVEELAVDITAYLQCVSTDPVAAIPRRRLGLTVTGLSTYWTFPSSIRISLAFKQMSLTAASGMISHLFSCSICLSRRISVDRNQVMSSSPNAPDVHRLSDDSLVQVGHDTPPVSVFVIFQERPTDPTVKRAERRPSMPVGGLGSASSYRGPCPAPFVHARMFSTRKTRMIWMKSQRGLGRWVAIEKGNTYTTPKGALK
jgi:hypothetical protein